MNIPFRSSIDSQMIGVAPVPGEGQPLPKRHTLREVPVPVPSRAISEARSVTLEHLERTALAQSD